MMELIPVKKIMKHRPCPSFPENRIHRLIGEGKTPLEILDLDIPAGERLWVLTREGLLPKAIQHEFGCLCVEDALHIWEYRYPDNMLPRKAIETKRRWMCGEVTDKELQEAMDAAADAADVATYSDAIVAVEGWTKLIWSEEWSWYASNASATAFENDSWYRYTRIRQIAMMREIIERSKV